MSDLNAPSATSRDRALQLAKRGAKGVLGALPVVGPATAEVIDYFFRLPLEERRNQWFAEVGSVLEKLRTKQPEIGIDALSQDPEFITTLHRATDVAIRTHQQEKIAALRAAVLSSALPSAPGMDLRSFFLHLVEELSPTHLRILALYNDPRAWFSAHGGTAPTGLYAGSKLEVLKAAYPDLVQADTWRVFADQLEARELMGGITAMMSGASIMQPATTPLGKRFVEFITEPPPAASE
jgi:hypothetical protein